MSKNKFIQREQEAKEAKQKLKAAEKAKAGKMEKGAAPKKNTGKKVMRWLRDFRGEIKKISWPDFKTVMKNTGIVLMTVLIIGIMVWILDFALTSGITGLKNLAQNTKPAVTEAAPETPPVIEAEDDHDGHDHGDEETTSAAVEEETEAATEAIADDLDHDGHEGHDH